MNVRSTVGVAADTRVWDGVGMCPNHGPCLGSRRQHLIMKDSICLGCKFGLNSKVKSQDDSVIEWGGREVSARFQILPTDFAASICKHIAAHNLQSAVVSGPSLRPNHIGQTLICSLCTKQAFLSRKDSKLKLAAFHNTAFR